MTMMCWLLLGWRPSSSRAEAQAVLQVGERVAHVPARLGQVAQLELDGAGEEADDGEVVARVARADQALHRQRDLLRGGEAPLPAHRPAHVEQQHGRGGGGVVGLVDLEVVRLRARAACPAARASAFFSVRTRSRFSGSPYAYGSRLVGAHARRGRGGRSGGRRRGRAAGPGRCRAAPAGRSCARPSATAARGPRAASGSPLCASTSIICCRCWKSCSACGAEQLAQLVEVDALEVARAAAAPRAASGAPSRA